MQQVHRHDVTPFCQNSIHLARYERATAADFRKYALFYQKTAKPPHGGGGLRGMFVRLLLTRRC
jgi:hypothetical protein